MKNMEMMRATESTLPMPMIRKAIALVTSVALKGSLFSPLPKDNQRVKDFEGRTRSEANACRVRGATKILPMAEEIVAAAKPIGIIGPQIEIFDIIRSVLANSSGL